MYWNRIRRARLSHDEHHRSRIRRMSSTVCPIATNGRRACHYRSSQLSRHRRPQEVRAPRSPLPRGTRRSCRTPVKTSCRYRGRTLSRMGRAYARPMHWSKWLLSGRLVPLRVSVLASPRPPASASRLGLAHACSPSRRRPAHALVLRSLRDTVDEPADWVSPRSEMPYPTSSSPSMPARITRPPTKWPVAHTLQSGPGSPAAGREDGHIGSSSGHRLLHSTAES